MLLELLFTLLCIYYFIIITTLTSGMYLHRKDFYIDLFPIGGLIRLFFRSFKKLR